MKKLSTGKIPRKQQDLIVVYQCKQYNPMLPHPDTRKSLSEKKVTGFSKQHSGHRRSQLMRQTSTSYKLFGSNENGMDVASSLSHLDFSRKHQCAITCAEHFRLEWVSFSFFLRDTSQHRDWLLPEGFPRGGQEITARRLCHYIRLSHLHEGKADLFK